MLDLSPQNRIKSVSEIGHLNIYTMSPHLTGITLYIWFYNVREINHILQIQQNWFAFYFLERENSWKHAKWLWETKAVFPAFPWILFLCVCVCVCVCVWNPAFNSSWFTRMREEAHIIGKLFYGQRTVFLLIQWYVIYFDRCNFKICFIFLWVKIWDGLQKELFQSFAQYGTI